MPSEHSPASTDSIPEWRQRLKADLGEDPARFLDRDLMTRPLAWVVRDDDHGGARMERVPDTDCATAGAFVRARIRGIDSLARIAAWKAVERRLGRGPDGGPREAVIELLEEREAYLEEHGDRAERIADAPRRDAGPTESSVVWPEREGGERSATYSRPRAFGDASTDGGEA